MINDTFEKLRKYVEDEIGDVLYWCEQKAKQLNADVPHIGIPAFEGAMRYGMRICVLNAVVIANGANADRLSKAMKDAARELLSSLDDIPVLNGKEIMVMSHMNSVWYRFGDILLMICSGNSGKVRITSTVKDMFRSIAPSVEETIPGLEVPVDADRYKKFGMSQDELPALIPSVLVYVDDPKVDGQLSVRLPINSSGGKFDFYDGIPLNNIGHDGVVGAAYVSEYQPSALRIEETQDLVKLIDNGNARTRVESTSTE